MKIQRTIRMQVMRGNSAELRALLLTKNQIRMVNTIKKSGGMTAKKLSKKNSLSIQNASTQLKLLHTKGYLVREIGAADSGGIEYIYKVNS